MSTFRRPRARLALGLLVIAAVSGCGVAEQNPLNVNTQDVNAQDGGEDAGQGSTRSSVSAPEDAKEGQDGASFISADLDDDPLNIRADGATLCGVQPKDSFLQYTIMLHNPTLETFTFDSVDLVDAQGLGKIDAKITPANREGHGNHGASPAVAGGHGAAGHDATPTPTPSPTEPSTFSVEPVPAVGYQFEPDQHINIVVSVALEESATRGTADDVLVGFSATAREFSVPHDLNITIDKSTCS
ncbi:hypothetical protein GM708_09900 [Vibrio cholerae]|nr:hypothetical protein [Vibrio cholerae]